MKPTENIMKNGNGKYAIDMEKHKNKTMNLI